jgi:hypothetical protein
MLFYKNSTDNFNTYNSNLQTAYVKEKHDLYKWTYTDWPNSEPIFGGLNSPGQWGGLQPNGYNENCYINDGPYVPDLSGKFTRPRQYGWPQSGNWYHHFGLVSSSGLPHRLYPTPNDPITDTNLIEKIQDISFWNYGFATGVLLSPRHIVTTKHAFIPSITQLSMNFILKDGTVVNRIGTRVTRPGTSPTNGSDANNNLINGDCVIFRLSAADSLQPYVNAGLITVYDEYLDNKEQSVVDFFKAQGTEFIFNENRIISWVVEGGERVERGVLIGNIILDVNDTEILHSLYCSSRNLFTTLSNVNKKIDDYQMAGKKEFVGDSGSPLFCYDKNSGKTILLSLDFGAYSNYVSTDNNNLLYLQQELQNNGGYSMKKLNINQLDFLKISDYPLINLNPEQVPPTNILPSKPYSNEFTNISTTPLYRYPYSSRVYSNGQ